MTQLPISINGKVYNINCSDSERDSIVRLSEYVNHKIALVHPKCKSMSEVALLSFSLLAIADDVSQAYKENERLCAEIASLKAHMSDGSKTPIQTEQNIQIQQLKEEIAALNERLYARSVSAPIQTDVAMHTNRTHTGELSPHQTQLMEKLVGHIRECTQTLKEKMVAL